MLEVTSLLFHTNKNNQISFDKDTKSTKDVSVSEHSFQKTLESYQGNRPSENAVEKNKHDAANNEKIISRNNPGTEHRIKENQFKEKQDEKNRAANEDDGDLTDAFYGEAKTLLMEMLTSLFANQGSNNSSIAENNIVEGDLHESLKTMVLSIQKAAVDKSKLSANTDSIMDDIQKTLEPLLLQDEKLDGQDLHYLTNSIKMALESLSHEDTTAIAGKQDISIDNINNTLFPNVFESDVALLDRRIIQGSYDDPSINLLLSNDLLMRLVESEAEEFKQMQDTAGAAMSSDVGSIEDLEIVAYEGYQIEDVQSFTENNLSSNNLIDNQLEEKPSNFDVAMDPPLAGTIETDSNTDTLDITKILGKNSPTASIEIIQELAEKISMQLKSNRYEMELQIKPESLGKLVLKVTLEDGILSGRITTTNRQTANILQQNLDDLKSALEQQGYKFSQLDVNVGNEREPGHFHQHWRNPINFSRNKQSTSLFNDVSDIRGQEIRPISNHIVLSKIDYFA